MNKRWVRAICTPAGVLCIFGAVAVLCVIVLVWQIGVFQKKSDIPELPTNESSSVLGLNADLSWKEYRNGQLGIRFMYPQSAKSTPGDPAPEFGINNAEQGRLFHATIPLPSGRTILMASPTYGFTTSKEWNWRFTRGYIVEDGVYYVKTPTNEKVKVIPSKFWPMFGGKKQALIINEKDFSEDVLYKPEFLAVINLPQTTFAGLGIEFSYVALENPQSSLEADLQIAKELVASIESI